MERNSIEKTKKHLNFTLYYEKVLVSLRLEHIEGSNKCFLNALVKLHAIDGIRCFKLVGMIGKM